MTWTQELQRAVEAVRAASLLCQAVQRRLVRPETLEKRDKSPVTVADFASQAVVCGRLKEAFPDDPVVAEEDSAELRTEGQKELRRLVVEHVSTCLRRSCGEEEVLGWIDHGGRRGESQKSAGESANADSSRGRFWTLDPIDGTKGFLRGEQYAVALALIDRGEVVLGVLGCPNLPVEEREAGRGVHGNGRGALLVAVRGKGAELYPLADPEAGGMAARVSAVSDPAQARFCESVESGHSNQGQSAQVAGRLGITAQPLRMDSQAKYATVARGDASVYLRMPTRADYQEKIWDHAAGMIIVQEAGGRVTDIDGRPLDFGQGATLARNRGVVATNGAIHDAVIRAISGS